MTQRVWVALKVGHSSPTGHRASGLFSRSGSGSKMLAVTTRTVSIVAWSLCGLALALFVAFLVLSAVGSSTQGPRIDVGDRVFFAIILSYAAVGALVASRRPANAIGWLLLGQGLLFTITAFTLAYVRYALFAQPGSLPGGAVMAWIGAWIWIPEFFALPALFFLLVPDGRPPSSRWRLVVWLIVAASVALALSNALAPAHFEDSLASVRNPFAIQTAASVLDVIGTIATAVAGPALIAALVSFGLRFRSARGAQRQQLKWVTYAAVVLLVSFAVGDLLQALGVPKAITSIFWVVPVALIPITAGIAILRYRLYDIDVLIANSLVFAGLVAFATAVYLGAVMGIGAAVGRTTGWNVGLAIAATAIVATAFQPARLRMHHLARRLAYRRTAVPERDGGVAIRTLGAFRLLRDGEPVPGSVWQSKKARTLLKILVARRGRSTTRIFLMDALWPEEHPDKLANRLSVALATVRSVLDPDKRHPHDWFVEGDKDAVRVNLANLSVDVDRFLDMAARGLAFQQQGVRQEAEPLLREAEATYTGDFLEEDVYEDWAIPVRDEARAAYASVARALARRAAELGDDDGVIRYYLRILAHDEWDEEAHLRLVEALERAGRHGEARRRYQIYASRMDEIDAPIASFPPVPSAPHPTPTSTTPTARYRSAV
jgi:DNA-binding SARP family transcriptional activator